MSEIKFAFDSKLDSDYLDRLYEGDKEHASIIFEQFLLSIHTQLKDMDDSYHTGDSEIFRQKVHKIKPIFSFVGLPWLTSQAELIENECSGFPHTTHVASLYYDFQNKIVEFIPVIENELEKLKV